MVNEFEMNYITYKKLKKISRSFGSWLIFKIIWYALFAFTASISVYFAIMFSIYRGFIPTSVIVMFFLAIYSGFKAFLYYPITMWTQFKRHCTWYAKNSWTERIEFFDSEMKITEEKNSSTYDYARIKSIVKKSGYVVFIFDFGAHICLMKDKFVSGCWEDCEKQILASNPKVRIVYK